jgi:hypothetical protein
MELTGNHKATPPQWDAWPVKTGRTDCITYSKCLKQDNSTRSSESFVDTTFLSYATVYIESITWTIQSGNPLQLSEMFIMKHTSSSLTSLRGGKEKNNHAYRLSPAHKRFLIPTIKSVINYCHEQKSENITVEDPLCWLRDTPLSAKLGTWQVPVTQSV